MSTSPPARSAVAVLERDYSFGAGSSERLRLQRQGASPIAWAGSLQPRRPHYYRVQSPHLLVEYDNSQQDANHVHTVWRDPGADFGRDVLAAHYRDHH
jgi:hypothetical protein